MGLAKTVCCGVPFVTLVVTLAAIAYQLFTIQQSLEPGASFALMRAHNATNYPAGLHSRYRGDEYTRKDRFFFQWWNFLVFDAETREHFNIIYQLTDYADNSTHEDHASVTLGFLRDHEGQAKANVKVPISQLEIRNNFDFELKIPGRPGAFLQEEIDDSTYRIRAKFVEHEVNPPQTVEWDLTFHRVHGAYGSQDAEETNKGDVCTMVSTLFAYNSEVEGTIKVGQKTFNITRTPRYRAYAAGSWGCQLPGGNPPVQYPWTWFWLVVPGATPAEDVSMVMGTAKFQGGFPVGDIYGGYAIVGMGNEIVSARMANLWHDNAVLQMPLQKSASDGFLANYELKYDNWANYSDEWGTAEIPLRQTYRIETKTYIFDVDFQSRVNQYFRAPVFTEKDLVQHLFSDFRAVGADVHIVIQKRAAPGAAASVLFDRKVSTTNAIEFAYEPAIDIAKYVASQDGKRSVA